MRDYAIYESLHQMQKKALPLNVRGIRLPSNTFFKIWILNTPRNPRQDAAAFWAHLREGEWDEFTLKLCANHIASKYNPGPEFQISSTSIEMLYSSECDKLTKKNAAINELEALIIWHEQYNMSTGKFFDFFSDLQNMVWPRCANTTHFTEYSFQKTWHLIGLNQSPRNPRADATTMFAYLDEGVWNRGQSLALVTTIVQKYDIFYHYGYNPEAWWTQERIDARINGIVDDRERSEEKRKRKRDSAEAEKLGKGVESMSIGDSAEAEVLAKD